MSDERTRRILVVTDHAEPTPQLRTAIRQRAESGDVQFRLIVLNPARAEVHLLHPERHDRAAEAEQTLRAALPQLEQAAGGPVVGSVSVRHDPMDAIEETLHEEDFDEIILSTLPWSVSRWLHLDLPHRVAHLGLPLTTVIAQDRAREGAA